LSKSSNLASEATSVLLLVGPELDLQGPGLAGSREDLSNSISECSIKLFGHSLDPQEISLEKVKGLTPDVHLLVGRHPDLPVAPRLVGVIFRVVWSLDGNLLSIIEDILSIPALQGFNLILCVPCICSRNSSEEYDELHRETL